MSHHPNVTSPEGTPLTDRTVGELVAERPNRSRIFQSFRIDFCCQGGRTLREACERKGVAVDSVVEQIEAEQASAVAMDFNPAELPAHELVDYIIETHHKFLRQELPRLDAMAKRVVQVHGEHTPSLVEVLAVFTALSEELDDHIRKEEQILFPMVAALSLGKCPPMSLDGPITCMIHEHEETGDALKRLHQLTTGFQPPADACNTYRALFAGLAGLEKDLHCHIHLENSVLFPRAHALAEAVAA